MRCIFKFTFSNQLQDFLMPAGAVVRSVQLQDGVLTMWAECETQKLHSGRRFGVYGTGHEIPPHAVYVGTVQQPPFVWHAYEL